MGCSGYIEVPSVSTFSMLMGVQLKVQEIREATQKQQSRRPLPGPQPIDSAHTRQFARNAPSYINVSFHLQDPRVAIGSGRLQGGRTDPFSYKPANNDVHGQCLTLESKFADFFCWTLSCVAGRLFMNLQRKFGQGGG